MEVRRLLHELGYRFRLHRRSLPGRPGLVFPSRRAAIFVHGCFWHRHAGFRKASMPATRPEFWVEKFASNEARDERVHRALADEGWRVEVIWECEVSDREALARRVMSFLSVPMPAAAEVWTGSHPQ